MNEVCEAPHNWSGVVHNGSRRLLEGQTCCTSRTRLQPCPLFGSVAVKRADASSVSYYMETGSGNPRTLQGLTHCGRITAKLSTPDLRPLKAMDISPVKAQHFYIQLFSADDTACWGISGAVAGGPIARRNHPRPHTKNWLWVLAIQDIAERRGTGALLAACRRSQNWP